MGISKFKKEHNKAIEHMKSPEFKGFTTSFEEGKEEVTEIRARKLSPLGWELVWRYRLKELEDREQKWKKQNKQIKSLKHQLAECENFMRENEWSNIDEMRKTLNKCEEKYKKQCNQLAEKDALIKQYENGEIIPAKVAKQSFDMRDKLLSEKDKEVEEYNNYFKSFGCKNFSEFQELIGLTKVSANDKDRDDLARHQVCEEIREILGRQKIHHFDTNFLSEVLDKVEGESK